MNLESVQQRKLPLLSSDLVTAIVLSWVSGYIDAAGFLKLNGLFTVHITGNLVVAGIQIAGVGGPLVWVRLAVIPVFIAAVVLTTVFARKLHPPKSSLLGLEVITLVVFAIVSISLIPVENLPVDAVTMFVVGSTAIFAMAVQNTLMREIYGSLTPTTVMTGNLTQFTIDLARLTFIHDYRPENIRQQKQEIGQRMRKFGGAILGFCMGTVLGAFLTRTFGFWSMLLPIGAVGLLAITALRCERISKVN
jgi:uncharacterized membrane protein YoaK (UPF0700 family)